VEGALVLLLNGLCVPQCPRQKPWNCEGVKAFKLVPASSFLLQESSLLLRYISFVVAFRLLR